jgi:hypothetical protein
MHQFVRDGEDLAAPGRTKASIRMDVDIVNADHEIILLFLVKSEALDLD